MAVTLDWLIARLRRDVRPLDGVPDDGQIADAAKDAVAALSEFIPATRTATIAVTQGVASYALPADFLRIVEFTRLRRSGNTLVVDEGLIPLDDTTSREERVSVAGENLVIAPTPTYTASRTLLYAAAYALTGDVGAEAYADLSERLARVALIRGRAALLGLQANAAARTAYQWQGGDERIAKEKLSAALRVEAQALEAEFQAAAAALSGAGAGGRQAPYGSRARYEPWG